MIWFKCCSPGHRVRVALENGCVLTSTTATTATIDLHTLNATRVVCGHIYILARLIDAPTVGVSE